MSYSNGSCFHRISLDMCLFFRIKTLKHGSIFQNVQNFVCQVVIQNFKNFRVSAMRTPENCDRPGSIFRVKPLEMGTFFSKNDPQKRVTVSRLGRHVTFLSNPSTSILPGVGLLIILQAYIRTKYMGRFSIQNEVSSI